MIKVRVLQNVGVGVAGAAAFAGIGAGTSACTTKVEGPQTSEAADTTVAAGTGVIHLQGYGFSYASLSGGDEFIRAGEKLTATIGLSELSYYLGRNAEDTDTLLQNGQIQVVFQVTYQNEDGSTISTKTLPVTFDESHGEIIGTSAEFTVPSGVPHMKVSFVITDETGKTTNVGDGYVDHPLFAIFGAFLPNKLALFDKDGGGAMRVRVVEGGSLVPGKNVTISYTDWRADTEVDKYSIDTTIGDGTSYTRFGTAIVAIHGDLKYQIAFTYSVDGGTTWVDGGLLDAHANPDVLNIPGDQLRMAYEKTFQLPESAVGLKIAFHIQAVLVADPHYQYVNHWKDGYQLGGQYVMRDVWDNNGGTNYDVPVSQAGQ